MFKILRLILIVAIAIVLTPFSIKAGNLQFSILNESKKELDPGANFNVIAKFVNQSSDEVGIEVKIVDPASPFKFILDYSNFLIGKNTSFNRILGFQTPSTCSAGEYLLELEAFDKRSKQSIGKTQIPITVKPRFELSMLKLNTPQYLMAGDTVSLYSVIQNQSNSMVKVKATTVNGSDSKVEIIAIPKDSSIQLKYFTTISKDFTNYTKHFIYTTAQVVDQQGTEKQVSYSFDVFPNKNVKFDRYNRFPIRIGSMVIATNRWGGWTTSSMFDINGSGTFGRNNDKKLTFSLRGPDRQGDPLLGLDDSYSLRYESKKLEFSVGDENFNLTNLTESSRSGRGLKATYKLNKLSLGGFYNIPRYYPLLKNVFSVFSKYDFDLYNNVMVGALLKNDTTHQAVKLYSLSSYNRPFSWLKTDLEVAVGQDSLGLTKSYNASVSIYKNGFSTFGNYVFADPTFPGYISNSTRLTFGTSFNLKKFNFNLGYGMNRTNLALDTLYSNMPYTKNFNMVFGYRIFNIHTLSLGGFMTEALDRSPTPLFNYTKYTGRLSFQSTLKSFSIGVQGDYGRMYNWMSGVDNKMLNSYSGALNFAFNSGSWFSANGFLTYQGEEQGITGNDLIYYGSSIIANMGERFLISLQYNSNFEWQYYNSDRSLLNLNLKTQLNANNQLSVVTSYNLKKNTLNTKELNIQLRYIYTLNIPVSLRKDVGSLTGKIINHGIERVSGVRLKIDGNVVISDKDGNFRFPALPVGTHMLGVDVSSFGLNTITETPGPYLIEIEPGLVKHFEFAMTKAARITGKLIIQEDNRVNQKGYISVKEEIERLIIEATNNDEVFRVYTDRNSAFSFNDLRPGDWKVKVYTNSLPRGYQIETTQFSLSLKPGDNQIMEIPVKKVARQIQFQTPIKK